jgi:hypothetical protein
MNTSKHDGNLDEEGQYKVSQSHGSWGFEGVFLESKGHIKASFSPKQALSLLAWLRQEEDALKQLAGGDEV